MKLIAAIARYLLGLVFTVFGLNGFLHFIPQQPMPAGPATEFVHALSESHYIVAVFAVQLACGVLLLVGWFVPLALVCVAPVIVNILLFHITMAPGGVVPGAVVALLWAVVALRCRTALAGLLRPRMPA